MGLVVRYLALSFKRSSDRLRAQSERPCQAAIGRLPPGLVTCSIIFCWLLLYLQCKKVFSTNTQSRLASVDFDSILGPLHLSVPHQMMSLYLRSSRSNVLGKVEGPWRAPCQLKKPFKAPRPRQGSCWEEQKSKNCIHWNFCKKQTEKWVIDQTWLL